MSDNPDIQELKGAIREATEDGKAPCRALLELAKRTGVRPSDVGRLCDEMKIRVGCCQLGCFK